MRLTPSFPQPAPRVVAQAGATTAGSPTVVGLTTAALAGALGVSGAGIPAGAMVQSIDSPTQATLTAAATATGTPTLSFALEPITLAEAKLHLRQTGITDDDTLIASLVRAARFAVESHLRQALLTQSLTLLLDGFPSAGGYYNRAIRDTWSSLGGLPGGLGFYPGMVPNSTGVIDVPVAPLQSIDAVRYDDFAGTLQTFDPSGYVASLGLPPRIQPAYSKVWPIARPTIDAVRISFTAGYGDTADSVPDVAKAAMKLLLGHWYEHRESVGDAQVYAIPDAVDALLATIDHGSYF